jgi:hypothetical protein
MHVLRMTLSSKALLTRWPRMAFVLVAAGCGATRPLVEPAPALKSDELVQIWSGGKVVRWHAVAINRDSVTGIPYEMSTTCDNCRRHLSRAEIDSIRLGHWTPQRHATIGSGEHFLIYSRSKVVRWNGVVIIRDSVTGVPYQMSTKCGSCRLNLLWADVDSIRVHDQEWLAWAAFGAFAIVGASLLLPER